MKPRRLSGHCRWSRFVVARRAHSPTGHGDILRGQHRLGRCGYRQPGSDAQRWPQPRAGREVSDQLGCIDALERGLPLGGYLVKRYPAGGGAATISPIGTAPGQSPASPAPRTTPRREAGSTRSHPSIGAWQGSREPAQRRRHGLGRELGGQRLARSGTPRSPPRSRPRPERSAGSPGREARPRGGRDLSPRRCTTLSGSPAFVGTDGNAAITSLGIPKSAGDGPHTVYALGDAAYVALASERRHRDRHDRAERRAPNSRPRPAPPAGTTRLPVERRTESPTTGRGSGVSSIKYTTDGSDPKTSGTAQVYTGSHVQHLWRRNDDRRSTSQPTSPATPPPSRHNSSRSTPRLRRTRFP